VGIARQSAVEPADEGTRQHLTEQRVTIYRDALMSREALAARIAAAPDASPPEAAPKAVSAKADSKSTPLVAAAPKAERKGVWGIFGRRAESKPAVAKAASALPEVDSKPQAILTPQSDSNSAPAVASRLAVKQPSNPTLAAAATPKPTTPPDKPSQPPQAQPSKPSQQAQQPLRAAQPTQSQQAPQPPQATQAKQSQQPQQPPQAAQSKQSQQPPQPPQAAQPKQLQQPPQPPQAAQPKQLQQPPQPPQAAQQKQLQQPPQPPQAAQPKQLQQPQRPPQAAQPTQSRQAQQPPQAAQPKQPQAPQPSQTQQPKSPPPQQSQRPQDPPPANDPNLLALDSGTQFMAAGTTFLTVLCAADSPKPEAAPDPAAAEAAAKEAYAKRRPRGRVLMLLSELATLIKSDPDGTARKKWRYAALAAAALVALATTLYIWNASERAFKDAIAHSDYPRAAAMATRLLDKHPDDIELKAKATDVGLKATVPAWLQKIKANDFDGAKAVLTRTTDLSERDNDLRPLIDELEWLGDLEKLVSLRGGPEAPIRIYADEDNIERIISRWNEDTGEHQRSLARIASYVPQFVDWYGESLTHLRRLQSESTVYLPVVERVKNNIATELSRDNPDVLKPSLEEIAGQYPRLGGMDIVRQDLARYTEIRHEARQKKTGRLFALLARAHFATPPFQQSFHTLSQSGQLPPADLLKQYNAATQTWREHNPTDALTELQKLTTTGPWGDYLKGELERRGTVASGFASLQLSKSAPDYVDRLLAFRETLDPAEDVYFVRATAADLIQEKDKVIAKAQDAITQARTYWQEYKNAGAIEASQRIETTVSEDFKSRAKSLAAASRSVQQAFTLYSLVDASGATQWTAIRDEIETEVNEQRSRLRDLSNVVEPALLTTKLALLGDANQ